MRRFRVVLLLLIWLLPGAAGAQELNLAQYDVFFEAPTRFVSENAHFPDARSNGDLAVVTYQEVVRTGPEEGRIYISLITSTDGRNWVFRRRVVGPIPFERESAPIVFSSQLTADNRILLAVSASATDTRVLVSDNRGISFREVATLSNETTAVAPRLSRRSDGGMLLFVSQSVGGVQSILYSVSEDLEEWSDFERLEENPDLGLNFLPFHTSHQGNEYVVFQSFDPTAAIGGGAATYQLYLKSSDDGGTTWSPARRVTTFTLSGEDEPADSYDNQRPFLTSIGGRLVLAWERRPAIGTTQVVFAEIDAEGNTTSPPEQVSDSAAGASYPQVIDHAGEVFVFWFNDPTGRSNVSVAARRGGLWPGRRLSREEGSSTFVSPVVVDGRLHVFWQNRIEDDAAGIVYLEPDQRVRPVPVTPESYIAGRRSAEEEVVYSWEPPADASGILGYNYVFSRDRNAPVPETVRYSAGTQEAVVEAEDDGEWYFRIVARDRAGNWSPPTTVPYIRDLTPPPAVTFRPPPVDEDGYLVSNSFTLEWNEPPAPDVAGYSYRLERVGPENRLPEAVEVSATVPEVIATETPRISRNNIDNGLYALSVAAIDTVGNVSEVETLLFRLNKYVPVTEVYNVAASPRDILGRQSIEVVGRGFTANGTIDRVILDADGDPPYDYVFERRDGDFQVVDNRLIRGPLVSRVPTGEYRLGLNHPERGLYMTTQEVSLLEAGYVSFGDYRMDTSPRVRWHRRNGLFLQGPSVLVWITVILLAAAAVFATRRLVGVVQEGRMLQLEVRAIVTGGLLPQEERERRIKEMKRRGIGLRVKFTVFIVILLVSVILSLALILGNAALQRQEETLGRALAERVQVLLQSVSSQAEAPLLNPGQNRATLASLTDQREVMDEAIYVTITGQGTGTSDFGFVWATNDPALLPESTPETDSQVSRSIDAPTIGDGGEAELIDPVSPRAEELAVRLDQRALEAVGNMPQEIVNITDETVQLILNEGRSENDPEVRRLDDARNELVQRLNATLEEVGAVYESYPEFDPENLGTEQTEFIFYQPVLAYRQGEAQPEGFFRGMVRIGISTEIILEQIADARRELIISTSLVAAGALAAGIIGALLLATIVVIPINKLVAGVEKIRDTEDKEKLSDHVIEIKTRDELTVLADTVNSMTQGLVEAAKSSKELTLGKEIQKMFIPLDTDGGRKLTTGTYENDHIEVFGYYEGADALSGDYFDQIDLKNGYQAFIKGDVSGHGASAALIMVEGATIFTSHFRQRIGKKPDLDVASLATEINELLSERQFKGRFFALTIVLLEEGTGKMYVTHAGDNLFHTWNSREGRLEVDTLAPAPATGSVDPEMMALSGVAYQQVMKQLHPGDLLLLFTDGIEESHHRFRTRDLEVIPFSELPEAKKQEAKDFEEGGFKSIEPSEVHEEFDNQRIAGVIAAALRKEVYELKRRGDLLIEEPLVFDFTTLSGTAEEVVLALMAVEKVYRLVPDPGATASDRIQVDRNIADFLKVHFQQYNRFFKSRTDDKEFSEYVWFSHLKEDVQDDDLTFLAIRKK
ncbi:MAG: SpoIIE family protein phosphatase [Spirochaetaceae bacterium]